MTAAEAKSLTKEFKALRPFARSPIARFDPTIWALVGQGRIDRHGIAMRHPTWRKAVEQPR
jgi:hypothetical protein